MDEQEQKPGDPNTEATQNNAANTGAGADDGLLSLSAAQREKDAAAAKEKEQDAAKQHENIFERAGHGIEHATGISHLERAEKRRQAFKAPSAAVVQSAINDVNSFINAMRDCDADTPEEMLADSDVQQAAVRARNGLKVFTGETAVTFSKPTSDAHLNVGTGGAVTGNTQANRDRANQVRAEHGDPVAQAQLESEADEEENAVPVGGVTKVPQPDAHVR